jgi:hypothetical protein
MHESVAHRAVASTAARGYASSTFSLLGAHLKHRLTLIFVPLLAFVLLAPGCQQDRPLTALRDGPRECVELERNCEAPAAALGEPYQHCYETGKAAVANACINYYFDCIEQCREASENLGAGGQGGIGGAGTSGESGGPLAGAGG